MKNYNTRRLTVLIACLLTGISLLAQKATPAPQKEKQLPPGTYYIVNVESGLAITPAMASSGQNVFLQDLTRDGTQRWKLIPNKQQQYKILQNGLNDLAFQPHPSVKDQTPIISLPDMNGNDRFRIIWSEAAGYWLIRNQQGNYLQFYNTSTDKEMRFGRISGGSRGHLWEFKAVGTN